MCTLKVHGTDPRLARFPADCGFLPFLTIEDGQTYYHYVDRPPSRARRRDTPGEYGFHVSVSHRPWSDLNGQFEEAIAYLAAHRGQLLRLQELRPRWAALDFPAEADPCNRHVVIFGVTVPVELSRASAEVGLAVKVTLYFAVSKPDELGPADGGSKAPAVP